MGIETQSLTCDGCGATLQIPRSARFVNCQYCSSKLAVHRSPDVVFTEALDELTGNTAGMKSQLELLNRHHELAAFDREWEQKKQKYFVTNGGAERRPAAATAIAGGIFSTAFLLVWIAISGAIAIAFSSVLYPLIGFFGWIPFLFPAFGVFALIATISAAAIETTKAKEFEQAEAAY